MKKYKNLLIFAAAALMAACTGNPGTMTDDPDDPGTGGDDVPVTEALTLLSSASYIESNGQDAAEFTVVKNGQDLTSEASIYMNHDGNMSVFEGTSFSSTEDGVYTFFASYQTERSAEVTVTVVDGILQLPEDPEPDRYEGFYHRLLAVQGTSLGCTYCPMMIAGATEFAKTDEWNHTVWVAAHGVMDGDDMISDYSTAVLKSCGIQSTGVPAVLFNLRSSSEIIGNYNGDNPASVCGRLQARAQALLEDDAHTGISVATSGTESSGAINVTASVKVGTTGHYRICAWVLEDDIYATGQMNSYPSLADDYDFTHHSNVLRCIYPTSPVNGVALGGKDTCEAGEEHEFVCQFNLDDMVVDDLANVRVVVIVTTSENGVRFTVDNAVSCALNETVAYEYE